MKKYQLTGTHTARNQQVIRMAILVLLMGLWAGEVRSQAADPYIANIRKAHKDIRKARIVSVNQSYFTQEGETLAQSDTSYIWIHGNNSKVKTAETEMLINSRCLIVVNHQQKCIQYRQRNGTEETNPGIRNLDSLLNQVNRPVFTGKKAGLIHYQLHSNESLYKKVDVAFDAATYLIREMTIEFDETKLGNPWTSKVTYPVFDVKPQLEEGFFDEKKYIGAKGGEPEASRHLAGYQVRKSEVVVYNAEN